MPMERAALARRRHRDRRNCGHLCWHHVHCGRLEATPSHPLVVHPTQQFLSRDGLTMARATYRGLPIPLDVPAHAAAVEDPGNAAPTQTPGRRTTRYARANVYVSIELGGFVPPPHSRRVFPAVTEVNSEQITVSKKDYRCGNYQIYLY